MRLLDKLVVRHGVGRCPKCGKLERLRRNGTLRRHAVNVGGDHGWVACKGSGRPPA